MANSTLAELQKKNGDLQQLAILLSTIILRNVVEQRELIGIRGREIALRLLAETVPIGVIDRLREVSLRCSELSRDCCNGDAGHALEGLSVELATEAELLEALLRVPGRED